MKSIIHQTLFSVFMLSATPALAQDIMQTRYGIIVTGGDDTSQYIQLQGRGRVVTDGNVLSIKQKFQVGARDLIVIEETGGTGCPALLYVVTISRTEFSISPQFGTCTDEYTVSKVGDTIHFSMSGFLGSFESAAARRREGNKTHRFTFLNGVVTENGRRVR